MIIKLVLIKLTPESSSMDSTAFIKAHNAPGSCFRTSVIVFTVFPDRFSARYRMLLLHGYSNCIGCIALPRPPTQLLSFANA